MTALRNCGREDSTTPRIPRLSWNREPPAGPAALPAQGTAQTALAPVAPARDVLTALYARRGAGHAGRPAPDVLGAVRRVAGARAATVEAGHLASRRFDPRLRAAQ